MNAVAPARKAAPARQAPPWVKASSKSSKATAVISAPEAKARRAAVTVRPGGRQSAIAPPRGSAADAIAANRIAWLTASRPGRDRGEGRPAPARPGGGASPPAGYSVASSWVT